ncbi:MAG: hypothetical protein PWQ39_490 [Thermacetogenium sp.]|nr:hypothetical protein [Thermacetogenium sp.]
MDKMDVFSYSKIKAFKDCPAAFYRRYVLGLPKTLSPDALLGRAVHAVITAAGTAGGLEYVDAALTAASALTDIKADDLIPYLDNEYVRSAIKRGGYFETHFEVPLDDFPLSPNVQGYIDYFREEPDYVEFTDWKTGHKVYHPLETYQMGLYAYYLAQKCQKPICSRLVFLQAGSVIEHFFSESEIEDARLWCLENACEIQERLSRLDPQDPYQTFPPKHSHLCGYCTWAAECVDGTVPDIPETMEQAQELGAKILHLEGCLDAMKEKLKVFVEANGPVPVDGKQFYFSESITWKWSRNALEKAFSSLLEAGADPFEVFTITSAGLKKLSWQEGDLLELGAKKSPSKRFIYGKA